MIKFIFLISLFVSFNAFAITTTTHQKGEFLGGKLVETMPNWFKASFLDLSEDVQDAIDSNRHVLVYFHQNGCPYCAKLVEDNFTNDEVVKRLKKDFDVIETNMWGDRELTDLNGDEYTEKQFSAKMRVQFTPTVLFFDYDGRVVLRLNGYQSSQKLTKALDYISGKNYQKQSFAKYINANRKAIPGTLNKNPIFEKGPHILSRSSKLPAEEYLAVFFEEPNCKECDVFHKKLMPLQKTKDFLSQMQIVRFNSQSNERLITPSGQRTTAKKWFDDLNLTFNPSIVFFDKQGNEVIRKDAMFKSFHFHGFFTYLLSGAYKTQPSYQRYLEGKADDIRETGKDVNIWKY